MHGSDDHAERATDDELREMRDVIGEHHRREHEAALAARRPCVLTTENPWENGEPKIVATWRHAMKGDQDGQLGAFRGTVRTISHTLLDMDALRLVVRFSPLIEIAAGTGYWARILRDMGADVIAVDQFPPDGSGQNPAHGKGLCWTNVEPGDYAAVAEHPDRTVFVCWPYCGYELQLLPHVRSRRIVIVRHASTPISPGLFDDDSLNPLTRDWRRVLDLPQPSYPFSPNVLSVWER